MSTRSRPQEFPEKSDLSQRIKSFVRQTRAGYNEWLFFATRYTGEAASLLPDIGGQRGV
jgi:hypothetical protein